jgi:hypothetical protein
MILARHLFPAAALLCVSVVPASAEPPERPLLYPNPVHAFSGILVDGTTADLDEDGLPDFIAVRQPVSGSNVVMTLRSAGNGLFDPPVEITLPGANQLTAVRFDEDAHIDIVALAGGSVLVLRGAGDGTFLTPGTVPGLTGGTDLAVGDLNGDLRSDIAILVPGGVQPPTPDRVRYVLQQPGGSFGPLNEQALYDRGVEVAIADINQDGRPDLLIGVSGSGLRVYYGLPSGAFGSETYVAGTSGSEKIISADFNLDGRPDVVTLSTNGPSHQIATYLGTAQGTLIHMGQNRQASVNARSIAPGDFDRDGVPDVATNGPGSDLYRGFGDGSFETARNLRGDTTRGLTVTNLNGDDWQDVLTWQLNDNYMTAYMGRPDGSFGQRTLGTPPTGGVFVQDFNQDGLTDILAAGTQISVLLRSPDGGFEEPLRFPGLSSPTDAALLDSNDDGILDVVLGNFSSASVALGAGDGSFGPPMTTVGGEGHISVAPLDFNQDGRDDVALSCAASICFEEALPNGAMGPHWRYAIEGSPLYMTAADLNQDGFTDLLTTASPAGQGPRFVVVFSHGDATFETGPSQSITSQGPLASADFDEDGKIDILLTHLTSFEMYRGLGSGQFAPPISWPTVHFAFPSTLDVLTADFDLDGHQDVAFRSDVLEFYLGDGQGGFPRRQLFAAPSWGGTSPPVLAVIEANGDGAPDLVVRSSTGTADLVLSDMGPLPSHAPVADAGADRVIECQLPAGAWVPLDASASFDLDSTPGTQNAIARYEWFENFGQLSEVLLGTTPQMPVLLSLGTHFLTLRVTDWSGQTSTDEFDVTVQDTTPPALQGALDAVTLWPPNHRMVPVTANVAASDVCGPGSVMLEMVSSSEPDDLLGLEDGITIGDVQGVSPGTPDVIFALRAERSALGTGRLYTATYRAQDSHGNIASLPLLVGVPHDVAGVTEPLSLRVRGTAAGTLVEWDAVPGAQLYNVVLGDLDQLRMLPAGDPFGSTALCLASSLTGLDTTGFEIDFDPEVGRAFFVLAEYDDGRPSGHGTESAPYDRAPIAPSSACP